MASNQAYAEFDLRIVRTILNRQQLTRLKEIQFQAVGMSYFLNPEARETLALEPHQSEAIWKILFDYQEQKTAMTTIPANATKLAEGAAPSPESKLYDQSLEIARKNAIKLHATTMRSIEQVLTNPQRGAYKALVGKPFSFEKPTEELPQEEGSIKNNSTEK